MALTRKLLESMGIESDKIETIIEAHTETFDAWKKRATDAEERVKNLDDVQKQLDEANRKLETFESGNGDSWQKKYEEEHSNFEKYKNDISAKELKDSKANAYKSVLRELGIAENRIDAIIRVSDLDNMELEIEEGKVKDSEKLIESIKTEWSEFIPEVKRGGADTKTPPPGANPPQFTAEDIRKMTPAEINANWDAVKNAMKG